MDPVFRTLRDRFGHTTFRPGQEALVRALLAGRDALGLLPTGGGKSLAYLLPAHLLDRTVLVVSPLVALMQDQLRRARSAGLRAEALAGPVPRRRVREVLGRVGRGTLDLLLLAPERLRGPTGVALSRLPLAALVVDEAHCLVQWGFDFRPDYLVLAGWGPSRGLPVLALTATATPTVRRTLAATLGLRSPVEVVQSFDRPNLAWTSVEVPDEATRWRSLWRLLRGLEGPGLVYAGTRAGVERLALAVRRRGIAAGAYHAGLAADLRARTLEAYLAGEVRVMVATNAFGMGVDKADIRLVAHWRPPDSLEAYYQEAGRGGRDGEPARAVALWHPADLRHLRRRLDRSRPPLHRLSRARWHLAREGTPADDAGWEVLARRVGVASGRDAGGALRRALDRLAEGRGWAGALRDRRAARARLRAVSHYLSATHGHRRRLLRYFGEISREPG